MFIEYLTMRTTNGDVKQMCWNSIISPRTIYEHSQIDVLSKFSDQWPIYWLGLGHTSVTSLAIDLRIGHQLENLKKHIDLRYRCL
jgi:hypothetical protein